LGLKQGLIIVEMVGGDLLTIVIIGAGKGGDRGERIVCGLIRGCIHYAHYDCGNDFALETDFN
jgi:hypothetical protein